MACALEPSEPGAEAVVDAVTEAEVSRALPVDVDGVGVGEGALVSVGGGDGDQHLAAGGAIIVPTQLQGLHRVAER